MGAKDKSAEHIQYLIWWEKLMSVETKSDSWILKVFLEIGKDYNFSKS